MIIRLVVALAAGALLGAEREMIGKEAGVRTLMMVASGAAIFAFIGLSLPYLIATSAGNLADILARNGGFLNVIANIVVGVGFLGGGIIIKNEGHVHGITTAAVVWVTAAIGTMIGLGLIEFGAAAAVIVVFLLYVLRAISIGKRDDQASK